MFRHLRPYTHQQKGRVECTHRHIIEFGLVFFSQANMLIDYWWKAFQTFLYLINKLSSFVLSHSSPYQLLFQKEPNYKYLKVFGCAYYPFLRPYNKYKLNFHTKRCVFFLGYSLVLKRYKCLSKTSKVYVSASITFESIFFFFFFYFEFSSNFSLAEHTTNTLNSSLSIQSL